MPSQPYTAPVGMITASAAVLDLDPLPSNDGYLRCLFGSQVVFPTTIIIGNDDTEIEMRELVALAPGSYKLVFRTVDGIPAPEPLQVQVYSDEVTLVLVSYYDSGRPQLTRADFPQEPVKDPFAEEVKNGSGF